MTGTIGPVEAVARVLVDSTLPQLDRLFDYSIPEELIPLAKPGVRVKVPLRSAGRIAKGYLVELGERGDYEGALAPLDSVVSSVPVLAPEVWTLARAVANRGAGSANDVLRLGIPGRAVRVEKAWLAGQGQEPGTVPDPGPIDGYPGGRIEAAIAERERIAVRAIPRLVHLGGETLWVGHWAVTMALAAVHCLRVGQSAILLVPDHRDQEQLTAALVACGVGEFVVRVDARQSDPERYRAFLSCLGEEPRIVLGNRSAIYAPARNLGLIAMWDEGDPLYTELLSPYVNVRDAALVRREQQDCALMFIGHTRSIEAQRLIDMGWLHEVLPERVATPKIVATAQQADTSGPGQAARIPSAAWKAASDALATGPILVQVGRPGYAPVLACQTCRQAARCTHCEGPLGLRRANSTPACGWCGKLATNWACDNCEGTSFRLVTLGAGRTAEELGRAFPGTKVIIADGERTILNIDDKPALVVSTRGAEPVAAGGYRAVLLLDGERILARESLHIGDDCLRWWSNAAALAAPGAPVFLVGVGGPLAAALGTWRQDGYARNELQGRRELRFPPAIRVASVTGKQDAVTAATSGLGAESIIDVLGPVPVLEQGTEQPSGLVRAIVRFDYAHGAAVAKELRAAIIRNAMSKRKPAAGGPSGGGFRPAPTLKVRFDDSEIL